MREAKHTCVPIIRVTRRANSLVLFTGHFLKDVEFRFTCDSEDGAHVVALEHVSVIVEES